MPTIYIDDEVFAELQKRAVPLVDNSNTVLRRLLGLDRQNGSVSIAEILEIPLKNYALKYLLIPVSRRHRKFYPGFKVPFHLETPAGILTVKVSSGDGTTPIGAPDGGDFITGGLRRLYGTNPPVKPGDVLRIEALEPGKRYRLTIIRK